MAHMRSATLILIAAAVLMMLCTSNQQQVAAQEAEDASVSMMRGRNMMSSIDCGSACTYRCSKAGRPKLCLKDCNICCQKCQCVPPGTAGNREVCPCYANLKNSKGTGKCP